MNSFRSWSLAQRYGMSVASVALTTLLLIQLPSLHQANIALLYLLVVLISATTIGLGPAMLASVLAFLGFNYFFWPQHAHLRKIRARSRPGTTRRWHGIRI